MLSVARRVVPSVRLLVAARSGVLHQGLIARLETAGGFMVVAQARSGPAAITALSTVGAEVAIIDLQLEPDQAWPLLSMVQHRPEWPPLLVLGDDEEIAPMARALRLGVRGWITAGQSLDDVVAYAGAVAAGQIVVPPELALAVLPRLLTEDPEDASARRLMATLTPRECSVLDMLISGHRSSDISTALGISAATVRTHIHRILRKLGVHSRTAAISLVLQGGHQDDVRRRAV